MQSTEAGKRLKLKKTDKLIQSSSIGATGSWKFLQRRRLVWIWLAHVSGLSAPYLQEISLVTHITIHVQTQTTLHTRTSLSPPSRQSAPPSTADARCPNPSNWAHQGCDCPHPWCALPGSQIHTWQLPTRAPWGIPAGKSCASCQCSALSPMSRCRTVSLKN